MTEVRSMIEVRSVKKAFERLSVLDGVSLSVKKGEVAVLIGPSGCGKSTLLRCLNGLERFDRGTLDVAGVHVEGRRPVDARTLRDLRRRVGMVFQQFHLFENMTVLENVAAGPRFVLGQPEDEARLSARRLLDRLDLASKAELFPEKLSGGQKQRVAIARALAVAPDAILFDEPTSALDPTMAAEVAEVIGDLAKGGQTMVVVTHSMGLAQRIADVVHVMYGGRIVESAPPATLFARPVHMATRALLTAARAS